MEGRSRREFLHGALTAGAVALGPRSARAADARVEVMVGEPIGRIAPEVYGHFVEHLGGVVYDGVWVGEGSRVANTGGVRQSLVDHMRRLPAAVVRWPGGCFADSYDWRDGVGPRDRRPRRTNFWADEMAAGPATSGKYDPNAFGTVEFARFCRLAGMQPYLAANLRSLPARDFYQWVEYCNSPAGSTSLAGQRGEDGAPEPLAVRFWGVGNESWGCGGNFTPREYATEYRRFTAWVPRYGVPLAFIASGPSSGEVSWTTGFLAGLAEKGEGQLRGLWGLGLHHYSWNVSRGRTRDWNEGKGDAVRFDEAEWYALLAEGSRMETLVRRHWDAMGEIDRQHRVKLAVDEWGSWHRPGSEVHPGHHLGQQSTLRDALLAALTLDIFHRHADKVAMGNIAQLVNCLQSLFLAHEDRFVATPNFHVFEMYGPHAGGQAVRTAFSAPRPSYPRLDGTGSLWGLEGSASVKEGRLTLTVVNPHVSEAMEAEVVLRGARWSEARVTTLRADDIHAHNTFDRPRTVVPAEGATLSPRAGLAVHRFPPASVTRLAIALG